MCQSCGCSIVEEEHHEVFTSLMAGNDHLAAHTRQHFDEKNIFAINLMGSPGCGKTTLLEHLSSNLQKFSVIEGDLATSKDADRLKARNIDAYQVTTGQACHLDAQMVHDALHHISLEGIQYVIIENVGNLVCPAVYDIGCHLNIAMLSTPEGDDKVEKYPVMFHSVDAVIISKTDLKEYVSFDEEKALAALFKLNPSAKVFRFDTKNPAGIDSFVAYLEEQQKQLYVSRSTV